MKRKWITKRIAKGMIDLIEIFKDKKIIFNGLTSDEIISLRDNLPLDKVLKMNPKTRTNKWSEFRTIKKYLVKTRQMAIIFKAMPKGTRLFCEEFGERILERETNIFFRCLDIEQARGYRSFLDKIGKGCEVIGEGVVSIAESQEKEKEIEKQIAQVILQK